MVRGSVDLVTVNEVHGWAYAGDRKGPVLVQAVLHHEIVGETTATIHRPDLAAAGLGDGNSGFVINLFRELDPLYLPFVVVKVNGGDAELPRSPRLGFAEFFKDLFAGYPVSGRSRSLLGGLWTDRTDAAAMLRGKTAIGTVTQAALPAVQALIHDGYAQSPMGFVPPEADFRDRLPEAIASLFNAPALLDFMHTVLDDQPLILRADFLSGTELQFSQASARSPSPSPAETLELLVSMGQGVSVDVVRDSHTLPEYTPEGRSRWVTSGVAVVGNSSWLDRITLNADEILTIGAGTIYRVSGETAATVLRLTVVPSRDLPVAWAADAARQEYVSPSGTRIIL